MENTGISESNEIQKAGKQRHCFLIFKLLLFLFCFSVAVFQVHKFLQFYWSYPEVIEIVTETDREFLLPAVTVCDPGAISRKKVCDKYPSYCENVTEDDWVCKKYPGYCKKDGNSTVFREFPLIDEDFYEFVMNNSRKPYTSAKITDGFWTGPFVHESHSGIHICFTLNSNVDNDDNSNRRYLEECTDEECMNIQFSLDLQMDNYDDHIYPWTVPGVHIHIHSPFISVNPMNEGTFIKKERGVRFHYSMEEEHLLPPPYKSNCKNYISQWEENNKSGPRSQKSCVEHCYKKAECRTFGEHIVYKLEYFISYCEEHFHKEEIGDIDMDLHWQEISSCISQCKPDCVKYNYPYTVEEETAGSFVRVRNDLRVSVVLDDLEIHVLKHRPQYQAVEIFSYIGGFLGLWLGISIYSFADIIEKTYIFLTSYCKRFHCFKKLQRFVSFE